MQWFPKNFLTFSGISSKDLQPSAGLNPNENKVRCTGPAFIAVLSFLRREPI